MGFALLPALAGALVLAFGAQGAGAALTPGNPDALASGLRSATLPIAMGLGLLLAAFAIARRSRLGLLLGRTVAVLMALAGIAFFAAEIQYLSQGGMSAAFAGPFMVLAAIWTALWLVYGWRIVKARHAFSPAWQPTDQRLGFVLAALILLTGGAWFGLGDAETQASVDFDAAYARAEALIGATSIELEVLDATVTPASGGEPAPVVERLVLELTVRSPEAYPLIELPSLCLVERATAEDPGYKQGVICWGTQGAPLTLERGFPDLALVAGATTVHLELERGSSPCDFRSGTWTAAVTIAPRTLTEVTDDVSPWPQSFTLDVPFDVRGPAGAAASPGALGPREDCLGVSP